jgi:hypothetical protein
VSARAQVDIEARIIAICQAFPGGRKRGELWELVDNEIETEGDLAKLLGRMAADGRLLRETGSKPGEFIYKAATVAAAAVPAPQPSPPPQPAKTPQAKLATTTQARAGKRRQRFLDALTPERAWLCAKEVAKLLDESQGNANYHLNALAASDLIQVIGAGKTRHYAAIGVARPAIEATPVSARARTRAPRVNLAELGVSPAFPRLPAPNASEQHDLVIAIDSTGVCALIDGGKTIKLSPARIRRVLSFLESTQAVWERSEATS